MPADRFDDGDLFEKLLAISLSLSPMVRHLEKADADLTKHGAVFFEASSESMDVSRTDFLRVHQGIKETLHNMRCAQEQLLKMFSSEKGLKFSEEDPIEKRE